MTSQLSRQLRQVKKELKVYLAGDTSKVVVTTYLITTKNGKRVAVRQS